MKRILYMVCILAMVLSLCNVAAFAEDTDVITITNGTQFNNLVKSDNFGKTFKIEGAETLADGTTGIILLGDQSSLESFYGTIKGEEGKNNIQITKPLIASVGQADTGNVVIDNIVLKGSNEDGTGALSLGDNVAALISAAATNYPYTVKITNVTNYLDVTSTGEKKYAGGILGYVRYRTVTIKNCINKGKISANNGDGAAGGIVGRFYGESSELATIENCSNEGDIESSGCAAGILGKGAPAGSIEYCANRGTIKSTSAKGTTTGAAGISFQYVPTSYCFNAGMVTSDSMAGGIWGTGLSTKTVSDCFNLGAVSSTNASCYPAGIVGSYSATAAIVTNCYNLGTITGTNPKQIIDNKSSTNNDKCTNNYYASNDDSTQKVGTKITLATLATKLPEGFSPDKWYYTQDPSYNYSLPHIRGNEFINKTSNSGWYIQDVNPSATFNSTKSFSPKEVDDEDYDNDYGNYSVVLTKMNLTGIEGSEIEEFGMYLLDKNGNCLDTAVAKSNIDGAFGILFYGKNLETGVTYKARPYVKLANKEYFGATADFQIAKAE